MVSEATLAGDNLAVWNVLEIIRMEVWKTICNFHASTDEGDVMLIPRYVFAMIRPCATANSRILSFFSCGRHAHDCYGNYWYEICHRHVFGQHSSKSASRSMLSYFEFVPLKFIFSICTASSLCDMSLSFMTIVNYEWS